MTWGDVRGGDVREDDVREGDVRGWVAKECVGREGWQAVWVKRVRFVKACESKSSSQDDIRLVDYLIEVDRHPPQRRIANGNVEGKDQTEDNDRAPVRCLELFGFDRP